MASIKFDNITPIVWVVGIIGATIAISYLVKSLGGAITNVGLGTGSAISNIGEGAGSALKLSGTGVYNLATGGGNALNQIGAGVYEIGKGTGSGISSLGEGVGKGFQNFSSSTGEGIEAIGKGTGNFLTQSGAGVYEIGRGGGYAISGLNVQDLFQTLLNNGGESSTYSVGNNPSVQNAIAQYNSTHMTSGNSPVTSNIVYKGAAPSGTEIGSAQGGGVLRSDGYGGSYVDKNKSNNTSTKSSAENKKTSSSNSSSSLPDGGFSSVPNNQATYQGLPIGGFSSTPQSSSSSESSFFSKATKTAFNVVKTIGGIFL